MRSQSRSRSKSRGREKESHMAELEEIANAGKKRARSRTPGITDARSEKQAVKKSQTSAKGNECPSTCWGIRSPSFGQKTKTLVQR